MKILIVDDDQRIVRTTGDILKIKGFETVAAFSGEEAVEKVKSDKPDCVLMDIKMPGINGVEAYTKIKELDPTLPVILVSAYATDQLITEAKDKGVYAVLSKPVNFQMLLTFLDLLKKEESILIVDDDLMFSKTLKDILQLRGFKVETEDKPNQVNSHLTDDYKLVVLLDINLGEVNGVDVMKAIRAKYPTKPVILVTGYRQDMTDSIRQGLEIGAYTCLYKPLEIESLTKIIEEISRKKRSSVLTKEY